MRSANSTRSQNRFDLEFAGISCGLWVILLALVSRYILPYSTQPDLWYLQSPPTGSITGFLELPRQPSNQGSITVLGSFRRPYSSPKTAHVQPAGRTREAKRRDPVDVCMYGVCTTEYAHGLEKVVANGKSKIRAGRLKHHRWQPACFPQLASIQGSRDSELSPQRLRASPIAIHGSVRAEKSTAEAGFCFFSPTAPVPRDNHNRITSG